MDLTNIDTLFYYVNCNGNGDIRFDYGGTTDDTALTNGGNSGNSDCSSYTGEIELKIQLKNDVAGANTNISVWGTKG